MGVTLITALVLALVSAYVELAIMKRVPIVKKLSIRYAVFSIVFSILLSYVLGMFFGASGVVPLIAGLLSTVMTEPAHAFSRMSGNSKAKVFMRDAKATYKPMWTISKKLGAGLFLPFTQPVKQYVAKNGHVPDPKAASHASASKPKPSPKGGSKTNWSHWDQ